MQALLPIAKQIAERLRDRRETLAVAESSAGGLVSAALLAQPGASAFFVGGAVVYTRQAREALLGVSLADMTGIRPSSEPYAALLAQRLRERLGATWGLAETGAAGPTGNSYGDPVGHTCFAVAGPTNLARTLETGLDDRVQNMQAFAKAALALFAELL